MGGSRSLFAARRSLCRRKLELYRDDPTGLVRVLARAPPYFL